MNFGVSILFIIYGFINAKQTLDNSKVLNTTYYDPQKCGRSLNGVIRHRRHVRKTYYNHKIMGGTDAEVGEHPWTVAVVLGNYYTCTGTLVSKKHVITAAHCFFLRNATAALGKCRPEHAVTEELAVKEVKIWYGSNCLRKSRASHCSSSPPMKTMNIVRAQYGRFFRQSCFGGDIALLELEHEIDEEKANYICLASRVVVPNNVYIMQTAGWGANPTMERIFMNSLQKLDLTNLMDREACKKKMEMLPNDVICTTEVYNQNVCMGDSGGGLMMQLDGRWLLLGVVSFGTACDQLLHRVVEPLAQAYTDIRMYGGEIDKFTGFLFPWEQI